jgi:hypothetical protein
MFHNFLFTLLGLTVPATALDDSLMMPLSLRNLNSFSELPANPIHQRDFPHQPGLNVSA